MHADLWPDCYTKMEVISEHLIPFPPWVGVLPVVFWTVQMNSLTPPLMLTHCFATLSCWPPQTSAQLHPWQCGASAKLNHLAWLCNTDHGNLCRVALPLLLRLADANGPTRIIFPSTGELSKEGNCGWRRHGLLSLMSKLSNHIWKQRFNVWYAVSDFVYLFLIGSPQDSSV